jgi:predicted XRE-type DNA-binding protein
MNEKEFTRQLEDETVRLLLDGQLKQQEIATAIGASLSYVQAVAKRRRCQRKRGFGSPAWQWKLKQAAA